MFEELGVISITCLLASLSGVLATYFMGKRMLSDDKIMDKIDMIFTNITSDTELQKKVYTIGVLLGSGVMQGTGIQQGSGGKIKLNDIIGQGIAGFIQNMMNRGQQQQTQQQQTTELAKKW